MCHLPPTRPQMVFLNLQSRHLSFSFPRNEVLKVNYIGKNVSILGYWVSAFCLKKNNLAFLSMKIYSLFFKSFTSVSQETSEQT